MASVLREFVEKQRATSCFFMLHMHRLSAPAFLPCPTFHAVSNIMSSPSQHPRTAPQTIANISPTYRWCIAEYRWMYGYVMMYHFSTLTLTDTVPTLCATVQGVVEHYDRAGKTRAMSIWAELDEIRVGTCAQMVEWQHWLFVSSLHIELLRYREMAGESLIDWSPGTIVHVETRETVKGSRNREIDLVKRGKVLTYHGCDPGRTSSFSLSYDRPAHRDECNHCANDSLACEA